LDGNYTTGFEIVRNGGDPFGQFGFGNQNQAESAKLPNQRRNIVEALMVGDKDAGYGTLSSTRGRCRY